MRLRIVEIQKFARSRNSGKRENYSTSWPLTIRRFNLLNRLVIYEIIEIILSLLYFVLKVMYAI